MRSWRRPAPSLTESTTKSPSSWARTDVIARGGPPASPPGRGFGVATEHIGATERRWVGPHVHEGSVCDGKRVVSPKRSATASQGGPVSNKPSGPSSTSRDAPPTGRHRCGEQHQRARAAPQPEPERNPGHGWGRTPRRGQRQPIRPDPGRRRPCRLQRACERYIGIPRLLSASGRPLDPLKPRARRRFARCSRRATPMSSRRGGVR